MYKLTAASALVLGSLFGSYQAGQLGQRTQAEITLDEATQQVARTLVVNIGSENHVKAVNGLLYAYHSLRNARGDFGTTPFPLVVKVAFGGAGVLHASANIAHPEVNITTHPQDPVKTADVLIATLVGEGVEMLASGFALKHYDVDSSELLPGISAGNVMTHPSFIASPESRDTFVMNF